MRYFWAISGLAWFFECGGNYVLMGSALPKASANMRAPFHTWRRSGGEGKWTGWWKQAGEVARLRWKDYGRWTESERDRRGRSERGGDRGLLACGGDVWEGGQHRHNRAGCCLIRFRSFHFLPFASYSQQRNLVSGALQPDVCKTPRTLTPIKLNDCGLDSRVRWSCQRY